jgi:hypothetical protein
MVYLPKIIPRVPSNLSLRFKPSDFKYNILELDSPLTPIEQRGCSQRLKWKTMSTRMRIATISLLVGICVAIQLMIILLIRHHYRRAPPPPPEIPDSVKFPWRQFEEYVPFYSQLIIERIGNPSSRIIMKVSSLNPTQT